MNDLREVVTRTLSGLGLDNAKSLGEQLVCLGNSRVGVRFAFEGVSAIWLNDGSLVRFVDDSGRLLKVARIVRNELHRDSKLAGSLLRK
jgi:hypothetical protein